MSHSPINPSRQPRTGSIVPGSYLGLMGGGQLGRMFAIAAQALGFRVVVLDPDEDGPAVAVCDEHLCAAYDDHAALDALAALAEAVTTEFENVPAESLSYLARSRPVAPDARSVSIAQDRHREKQFISETGLTPAPYLYLESPEDLPEDIDALLPGILKATRLGYDGKGQVRVATRAEVRDAFAAIGAVPAVLERMLELDYEVSVVVARDASGHAVTYPVTRNIHRNGILAVSIVPSEKVSEHAALGARAAALLLAARMEYVGILCVEFFVLLDGSLVVNEVAPRPHNSGHFTIDSCVTSQFEQQVRILANLPLGSTEQHSHAVMLNLLGELWFPDGTDERVEPPWDAVLTYGAAKLHLYGKREPRVGRKMGHLTVVGHDAAKVHEDALALASLLGIATWV